MNKKKPVDRVNKDKQDALDLKQDISSFFTSRDKTADGPVGNKIGVMEVMEAEAKIENNLYKDSLREVPLPEGVEPMFNTIFVTTKKIKKTTEGGIMLVTQVVDDIDLDYEEVQRVMAVGPQVQQVAVGDEVCVNFANFRQRLTESMAQKVRKDTELKIPFVTIDDREYIMVSERDLKYIIKKK